MSENEYIRIKICNLNTVPDKWVWQLKVGNIHHATSAINYNTRREVEEAVLMLFGDSCGVETEDGIMFACERWWEA